MRVAKKSILILAIPFLMAATQDGNITQNNPYASVTNNQRIEQALDSLTGTAGEWARKAILGDNLSGKPIKIEFKDLSKISPEYATFDALGWKEGGRLNIYLSNRHINAPIEAIASILCHESIHQDEYSSIAEETYGWGYEATVWMQMKKKHPELSQISSDEYPLVDRLNMLEGMFKAANNTTKQIRYAVSTNPGYKGLPASSPGFNK